MKILFLDADGVINCAKWFKTSALPRHADTYKEPAPFDPYRVLLVNRICEATGAKIVISSSWRLHPEGLEDMKTVAGPHYLDRTPHHARFEDRHAEITEWLSEHPEVTQYAILDDDACAGDGHGDNFFKTEWYGEGLTDEIALRVITHLGQPMPEPAANLGFVCSPCGVAANVLTCLKKFGAPPLKLSFETSTFHDGRCDFCGKVGPVTQARDFFYPDFSLLRDAMKAWKL